MFGLGMGELAVVAVVVVVFFGAKRLPQMGGSLGKALKNFKSEVTKKDEPGIEDKSDDETKES